MTRRRAVALVLLPMISTLGCGSGPTETVFCPAILIPSVAAEIRDANGQPAATGATLRLIGAVDLVNSTSPAVGVEPLMIYAGGNLVAGPMDIEIGKPGFSSVTVRNVSLPVGDCSVKSRADIAVTLRAPPAASVAVLKLSAL